MRALVFDSFGGPEVLRIAEVPVPAAGPGQVRVRVEAATVHPVDLATRSGALAAAGLMAGGARTGLGWDVAGVVEETGPGVTALRPGDRVIGMNDRLDVPLGTQAEQVVLDAHAVVPAPAGLAPAAAATLPLAGLTALQALDALALPGGETLLVTGAAGAGGGGAGGVAPPRGPRGGGPRAPPPRRRGPGRGPPRRAGRGPRGRRGRRPAPVPVAPRRGRAAPPPPRAGPWGAAPP
ncbi:alcohol dehydrogenase catalytic domain-containing protein, partial [Streptomyces griseus]|uniref:alcohol dehydrogenase catalytic domain-containing protein n=1 Tax=Streptomyces griseus TaxID=1911 RepID=UPI00131A7D51